MQTKMKQLPLAIVKTLGVGVGFGFAATANGQTPAPQTIQKIEVTGSNIKRVDAEGPTPVVVIKREDIEKTGATSVAEVLRNIGAQNGGSFEERTFGTFAPGSAGVSLRGLGQSATLVLINGRRVAGFGFAQNIQDSFVDLNTLPLGTVERIEVLKDGASAIYGSDAIAGVINVILRKDYRGLEVSGYTGAANSGSRATAGSWDAQESKASLTGGFGDIAKDKYNVVVSADYYRREHLVLRDRKFSASADMRGRGGVDNRSPSSPTGTVFNYSTGLYQALPGCPATDLEVSAGGSICKFNFNRFATIIPSGERVGMFTRGTLDINQNLSAFSEISMNVSKSHSEFAPVPSGTYFAAGAPGNPIPAANVFALRRLLEFGPRMEDINSKFTRYVAGVKGTHFNWDWESALAYSKSDVTDVSGNRVRADLLRAAIANGTFLIGVLNPPAVTVPMSIGQTVRKGISTFRSLDVKGSTELMQMAGGAMGLALGAEKRHQSISDVPDPLVAAGLSSRETATGAAGSRSEWSVYGELAVPFLKGWESQLALRHDNYEFTGSTTKPKVAVSWRPGKDILLRASYAEGFRAPGLQELYLATSLTQVVIVDGTRCRAGVAAACGATQVTAQIGGNITLKPEESKSHNLGVVWDAFKNFSIGVDFYRIEQKNKVNSNAQFVVDNEANPPAGASVTRAPSPGGGVPGRITRIIAPFINVSSQEVQGTDLDLSYRMNLGNLGKLTLASNTAYIDYLKQAATPTAAPTNVIGTGTQGFSYPRTRNRTSGEWVFGNWASFLAMNFDSAYIETDVARASVNPNAVRTVEAFTTFDLQFTYNGFKNTKLILGSKNLTDKDPPFKANATEGYDVERDNPRGRFFYVQANYAFK